MSQKLANNSRKVFEEKLAKALDEAWLKVNIVNSQMTSQTGDAEMSIRLAAEAAEYSSALFSLTYGLEDLDPEIKVDRNKDPFTLVNNSVEFLRRARELRQNATAEAYASLRTAADTLKIAYLNQVKKTSKRTG